MRVRATLQCAGVLFELLHSLENELRLRLLDGDEKLRIQWVGAGVRAALHGTRAGMGAGREPGAGSREPARESGKVGLWGQGECEF